MKLCFCLSLCRRRRHRRRRHRRLRHHHSSSEREPLPDLLQNVQPNSARLRLWDIKARRATDGGSPSFGCWSEV